MKRSMLGVAILALAAVGCGTAGTIEDFSWSLEAPKSVDKGSEFMMTVKTDKGVAAPPPVEGATPAETPASAPVPRPATGIEYYWQIQWAGGSSDPLRHKAWTGEPVTIRARLATGPAIVIITSRNKAGLDVKILESTIEVK